MTDESLKFYIKHSRSAMLSGNVNNAILELEDRIRKRIIKLRENETKENIKKLSSEDKIIYASDILPTVFDNNSVQKKVLSSDDKLNDKVVGGESVNLDSISSFKNKNDYIAITKAYFEELKELDPDKALELEPSMDTLNTLKDISFLERIYDNIRAVLASVLTESLHQKYNREELHAFVSSGIFEKHGISLHKKIDNLLKSNYIEETDMYEVREEYLSLVKKVSEESALDNFMRETGKFLKNEGYSFFDDEGRPLGDDIIFNSGESFFMAKQLSEYWIKCSVGDNLSVKFQQLKVVSSREEALKPDSGYQKIIEKEQGEQWCEVHKKLVSELEKVGLKASTEILRHPGDALPVLVNKNYKKEKNNIVPAIQRTLNED
jgi:cell division protein FtsL